MVNFKKVLAVLLVSVISFCAVIGISAAESKELRISTKTVGSYELEIKLENVCDYYLGNVDIKIEGSSGGVEIESYGLAGRSGSGVDTIRAVAPGETISLYAKIDPDSVKTNTSAPAQSSSTQSKPVQSTPAHSGVSQSTPSQSASAQPSTPSQSAAVQSPGASSSADVPVAGVEADSVADSTVTGTDTAEESATGIETGEDSNAAAGETSAHSIHIMAPGESVTLYATLTGTEDEPVKVMPAEEIPPYTLWIALGVAVVLAVVVAIVVRKKKKNAAKDISAVIVVAILLTGITVASVDADTSVAVTTSATEIKTATPGNVKETVSIAGGKGNVVITAEYTIVPAAKTESLKSARRVPAGDESVTPQVNANRLVENAGPLTSHKIYIGANDFMFYGVAINDYTGSSIMASAKINKLVNMMNERDSWAKSNGIKLYLVIAPNKTTVYSEHVPDKLTAAQKTNADVVIEKLAASSTVEVIDLRQPLINAKSEYGDSLFYKYDTHWNNNGGFVGYTEIMRRINEDVKGAFTYTKNDYTVTDHETYMKDMAYYLGYYDKYTDYGPVYTLKSGMTATIGAKEHDGYWGQFRFCQRWTDGYSDALKYITYENKYNKGAPSVYVYRDSFAVSLVHFLKDSFHNSVFDWSYDFNKNEVLNSGADVVIMEVVEKQLEEFVSSRTFS